jgi:hypothetical protein
MPIHLKKVWGQFDLNVGVNVGVKQGVKDKDKDKDKVIIIYTIYGKIFKKFNRRVVTM